MSFWSLIGLASKKDIENINKQLEEMKNLIGVSISSSDNINATNNKIRENISNGFNSVKNDINNLNTELSEDIANLKNENMEKQKALSDMLDKINSQICKLNEKNETQLTILNDVVNGVFKLDDRITSIESSLNDNKVLKQLIKEVKENKKELDALNKDAEIVQQMIRVVWVNDIIDNIENGLSIVKKSK